MCCTRRYQRDSHSDLKYRQVHVLSPPPTHYSYSAVGGKGGERLTFCLKLQLCKMGVIISIFLLLTTDLHLPTLESEGVGFVL